MFPERRSNNPFANHMNAGKALKIYEILKKRYPDSGTALEYGRPHELLIATILSAQCTDARVNEVTKKLFKKYLSVSDFAGVPQSSLEKDIRSTGFFRSKAGYIIKASAIIEERFGGRVPTNMEDLLSLPGVARKTANIVLFHGFGKTEGIAVDTHVRRVSARLGLTGSRDPVKIEKELMALYDKKKWGHLTDVFISHGRKVCSARRPLCLECSVRHLCSFVSKDTK